MTSDKATPALTPLTIEVYTAPGRTFVSAIAPQEAGDEPTWPPSSATLIYGDHDAILVDALATYAQVDDLAGLDRYEGSEAVAYLHYPRPRRPLARSGATDPALSGSGGSCDR